jgi:thiol-disulfide isomerase/thioredoxin
LTLSVSWIGFAVLLVALSGATAWGLARRRSSGRLRAASASAPRLSSDDLGGGTLGERATLVHFSSAFCRPCVATRQLLTDVAERVPGVRHIEVDAESHLELVRALRVASTPTTLLLDATGVVRRRATGVPRRDEVLSALAAVVD